MTTPLPRSEFPVVERWTYLNHAGVAPLPRSAVDALGRYAAAVAAGGGQATSDNQRREAQVRAAGAALMGVDVADVAFVKNTTEGLALVASGLSWRPGDKVVVPSCEFPSNVYPWTVMAGRREVEVIPVEPVGEEERLPLDRFESVLAGGGVRVVAVSWVQYARGWRLDLEALGRLCEEHGAWLVVDIIQGLGVLPASLARWGVHAAAADGHKWLLGPEGQGFLFVAPGLREELPVLEPGWNAVEHRGEYEDHRWRPDPSARRYEGGTPNYAGVWGLGASAELLLDAGVDAIWSHVDGLCERLCAGLADAGARVVTDRSDDGASGIVAFALPHTSAEEAASRLADEGFVVRPRAGAVRASPHGYNTEDEVDGLAKTVAGLVSEKA